MGQHLAEAIASQPGMPDVGPLVVAIGLLLTTVLALVLVVILRLVRQGRRIVAGATGAWDLRRAALGTVVAPSTPLTATGGNWRVIDGATLVVAPGDLHRMKIAYTPDESSIAAYVRALLRARETWWTLSGDPDADSVQRSRTIMEVPAEISVPSSYEKGRTIVWDVQFTLGEDVPSTSGDWHTLSCDWMLVVSVNRPAHPDPTFEQPIIVTQPRDRLNAGVVDESEFSRYEEVTGISGAVRVDFRVHPTPLDLAAPGVVELLVTNSGPPIVGREVRLEVRVNAMGTGAKSGGWAIWQTSEPISHLPSGPTELRFDIPAINRPCPDVDLLHGRLRGKLRFVVDIPNLPDITVERDLCLCLDKPEARAALAGPGA